MLSFISSILPLVLLLLGAKAQDEETMPSSAQPSGNDMYTKQTRFGTVECDFAKIRIEIEREQLAAPIERYTLIDATCKPTVTDTHIIFEYGPYECGTAFEGNETHWLLSNVVVNVDFQNPPMPGSILLHNHQRGTFRCAYPKNFESAPATFSSSLIDYEYPLNGLTMSEVKFDLYTDKERTAPVDVTRKLKLNSTLYGVLSRQAIGDTGTFIVPSECHAFSEADPVMSMPMLRAGCWGQKNYIYLSHTNDEYEFSFPVFGFVARGELVRIQCTVHTCKTGNTGEECTIPREACDFGPVDPVEVKPPTIVRRGANKQPIGTSVAKSSFRVDISNDVYEVSTTEEPDSSEYGNPFDLTLSSGDETTEQPEDVDYEQYRPKQMPQVFDQRAELTLTNSPPKSHVDEAAETKMAPKLLVATDSTLKMDTIAPIVLTLDAASPKVKRQLLKKKSY